MVGFLVRGWMYLSPVVYSEQLVPPQLLPLYRLNPMASVIEGFRWSLLGEAPPDWGMVAVSFVLSTLVLVGGLYHLKRVERDIVDFA
jgi:lipopolysaccharide transport system permease protein